MSTTSSYPGSPVTGVLAVLLGVGGMVAGRTGDAPGVLLLGVALVIGTVAVHARRARPWLTVLVGAAGMAAGASDDAPGAVLMGLLLVAGALAWSLTGTLRRTT